MSEVQREENEVRLSHLLVMGLIVVFCLGCWAGIIWTAKTTYDFLTPYALGVAIWLHP